MIDFGIDSMLLAALMIVGVGLVSATIAARLTFLPLSAWLIIGGFFFGLAVEHWHLETGIRGHNITTLVFYILLPVLVFEAAYLMPYKRFIHRLPSLLILGILGLLSSIVVGGYLLYVGINHVSFTLLIALLAATMLSATDPLAVVLQIKRLSAPEDLKVLIEGESLFNDATAIVVFSLVLGLLTATATTAVQDNFSSVILSFSKVFFGGAVTGLIFGYSCEGLRLALKKTAPTSVLSLFTAYASFYVAEHIFHVSGVMAVLVAALVLGLCHSRSKDSQWQKAQHDFWESLSYIYNVIVFVIMGLVITVSMFTEQWLAMLIAIGALLIGRIVGVYTGVLCCNFLPGQSIPKKYPFIMIWGGLRGVIAIALALSLPTSIDGWFTVQSMVFGVVLFSLLVQATTTPYLMKYLNITVKQKH